MFHWSQSLQGFLTVPLVNWYCASLHVVLHMNALTVVLKWKIYYDCGVCSSNLKIYFSSLRMKHYYMKWETLTWLLLGKKQTSLFCCPLTLCLLSLVLMALHNFPTFSANCSSIVPVPHSSEQSLSLRELPAWNIWVTITSTVFQHRDPKADSLGPLCDPVLYSS